ncbi:hypothetical protein KTQ42_17370|uniref:Flp family type IVb pilin n=1 Tax=Noviherbaspirillum sp. L7-7A TaxID=2850560 RepID=UPI001C2C0777|nr:hypothetical protein [Noviherbaspirillum sp. L7-7A]MBV0881069.1 hypothetical protein [Noviherbaspirillum sp. L7-7A]
MSSLPRILKNDFGAGAVEYALLISLLSVGFALALAASGESLCGLNERVSQIFLTGTDIRSTCRPGSGNGNSSNHSNDNANPNANQNANNNGIGNGKNGNGNGNGNP